MDALHSNADDDDDESSGGHKGASVRLVAAFVGAGGTASETKCDSVKCAG